MTDFDGDGADAVLAFCRESFPDRYTGLIATDDPRSFVVYRVPAPEFDQALRSRFPGGRFDLRDAAHTEPELAAAADRIARDIETWRGRGVDIVAVAPDPAGTVTVFTTTPGPAAGVLPTHYDPIPLDIQESGPIVPVPPARWPRRVR
jgi:hypothetical protein